ncbi:DUF1329 domain-containing protein [Dyella terrae]|uniref:DUF1329 domain-containing protein n=1 Tax=Dyella terrae TaxID=522259 RepID=UPI001EFC6641|nr:DUF1329 domain-containing protein [Dyella terrae]ULU24165.1 DUF1329 protein [Dyella terrae]
MKLKVHLAWACTVALCCASAMAANPSGKPGGDITVFGAEHAGNADGGIPAYDGGLVTPPAGYVAGSGIWPDPFKGEKPLFSVNAANASQYGDKLTGGMKALLERFPTERMDVYPSHRTMHYPQWVLDNTVKNASAAKLTGKVEGDGVEGAFGGVAFPEPKDGYQVMWNYLLAFERTQYAVKNAGAYLVDSSGAKTELPVLDWVEYRPYYDQSIGRDKFKGSFDRLWVQTTTPPVTAGTAVLMNYPINYGDDDQTTWAYFPGQRRTRMAPDYKYDTPASNYGGVLFWDETNLFRGRMDRFDFKLIGKKEVIVPYNDYSFSQLPVAQVYGPKHIQPDAIRWELHRVWMVEATLKAGARHAYSKRVFYIDEDSWALLETDGYGQDGKLWRVGLDFPFAFYDGGGGMFTGSYGFYDLQKGNYFVLYSTAAKGSPRVTVSDKLEKPALFTPAGMAGTGLH